jgi:hypothetical protein
MKAKYLPGFQISIFLILIIIPVFAYSQGKQANYWYFGYHAGLNFNTGSPPLSVLSDGKTFNDNLTHMWVILVDCIMMYLLK